MAVPLGLSMSRLRPTRATRQLRKAERGARALLDLTRACERRPFFVAAVPFSEILISELWQVSSRTPLDIGSTLDPFCFTDNPATTTPRAPDTPRVLVL